MKLATTVALFVFIVVLGFQIFAFLGREQKGNNDLQELKDRLEQAKIDEKQLQAELEYFAKPANLEKELRARFNYRQPDEKLIIIVPKNQTGTVSSTGNQ